MAACAVTPRPHQIDALTDLTRAFASGDRTQLIMPCGSGKSLVARWHAEASGARRTIVLVPSLALVAQTLTEWRRAHGAWRFDALVVCSDPSTAAGHAERAEDAGTYSPSSGVWQQAHAKVTTDHRAVIDFWTRSGHRPRVIFATYHSSPVIAHAQAGCRVPADLLVADEAHRLARYPSEAFRCALDARQLLAARRLFMTATPLHVDNDPGMPDDDGALRAPAVSMSDETLFGPVAHTVTFAAAITSGLLCDYQVLVVASPTGAATCTPGQGTARAGRGRPPAGSVELDPLEAAPAALLDAARRHGTRRVLSYHGRVVKAAAFAAQVDGLPVGDGRTIAARCIHGRLPAAERAAILSWLAADDPSQVRVVTNARCLVEGIDVPAVDSVLFADPRRSVVDVVQAIGRVLRVAPGKDRGTIIIPVAVAADSSTGTDEDTELTLSQFGTVWAVVRGLRSHDDRLGDELDTARRQLARGQYRSEHPPAGRIQFVLPGDIAHEPLHLRLLQNASTGWETFYGLLEAYAWRTSGQLLARSHRENGVAIGEWAEGQRAAYRAGRLTRHRIARLEQIPGWVWDRADGVWQASFDRLAAFAEARGTVADNEYGTSVFAGVQDAEHRPLGRWIARQRQAFRDGELAAARTVQLAALPGWTWTPVPAEDLAAVDALRSFVAWEKHADVPDRHVEDDVDLGTWCWRVRRRRLTGRLAPALADEITVATPPANRTVNKSASMFCWHVEETGWRLALSAARQYAAREGHARVPNGWVETLPDADVNLGSWVAKQRHDNKVGRLPARKRRALDALPGWVWDGTERGYEQPLDLGGHPHGTAKGAQARCGCRPCVEYGHTRYQVWKAKRRTLTDGVPSGPAREHLQALLAEVAAQVAATGSDQRPPGTDAVAVAARVPAGVLRTVASGRTDMIRDRYDIALRATTAADVLALFDTVGSRGRLVMSGNERVPAGPVRAQLAELYAAGWPQIWVAAELGYDRKVQLGADTVLRRVADNVAGLYGELSALVPPPVRRGQHLPPLAQLRADGLLTTLPAAGAAASTGASRRRRRKDAA